MGARPSGRASCVLGLRDGTTVGFAIAVSICIRRPTRLRQRLAQGCPGAKAPGATPAAGAAKHPAKQMFAPEAADK